MINKQTAKNVAQGILKEIMIQVQSSAYYLKLQQKTQCIMLEISLYL